MSEAVERPEIVEDEHLDYLDTLKESGITNMFGAGAYVEDEFELSSRDARTVLTYWMATFEERHSSEDVTVVGSD